MKIFIKITAVCLIMIFSLLTFISCSNVNKMYKIERKILELDKDEYGLSRADSNDLKTLVEFFQNEFDVKLDGGIESYWTIVDVDVVGNICYLFSFEDSSDAKTWENILKEYAENPNQHTPPEYISIYILFGCYNEQGYCIESSDNVVIFCCDEEIFEALWN